MPLIAVILSPLIEPIKFVPVTADRTDVTADRTDITADQED